MNYNKFVFPAPKPSYKLSDPRLIVIPRFDIDLLTAKLLNAIKISEIGIPCLFYPCTEDSENLLIFFHANAEDAGLTLDFLIPIKENLKCHVLTVEYPGYGVYDGSPSEDQICKDSITVYDFLTKVLKISESNISVMGRSMGSGPSVHLCSLRNPANLVLISPYTSIRGVTNQILGKFFSSLFLIKERFQNHKKIQYVKCPVLFIHGKQDKLINCEHSATLADKCMSHVYVKFHEDMTHNKFNMYLEIVNPIFEFFKSIKFSVVENRDFEDLGKTRAASVDNVVGRRGDGSFKVKKGGGGLGEGFGSEESADKGGVGLGGFGGVGEDKGLFLGRRRTKRRRFIKTEAIMNYHLVVKQWRKVVQKRGVLVKQDSQLSF